MAGEQILIVEDNPKNMKLARDVLKHHGYATVEAVPPRRPWRLPPGGDRT